MMILKLLAAVFAVTVFSTVLLADDRPEGSLSCCDAIGAVPAGSDADKVTPPKNVSNSIGLFQNTTPKAEAVTQNPSGKKDGAKKAPGAVEGTQ